MSHAEAWKDFFYLLDKKRFHNFAMAVFIVEWICRFGNKMAYGGKNMQEYFILSANCMYSTWKKLFSFWFYFLIRPCGNDVNEEWKLRR